MTGYEAFSLYTAIKLHMTTDSYDFFKYNGKINISVDAFERRKDKYFFYKLSRKYVNADDYVLFLLSNFLENEKIWAGNLITDDCELVFKKRQKVLQSLAYIFENECKTLFEEVADPNVLLKVPEDDYPKLLSAYIKHDISIETVCLLNKILNFVPSWSKKISDDIFWPIYKKRILKYSAFITADETKYKTILKKIIQK